MKNRLKSHLNDILNISFVYMPRKRNSITEVEIENLRDLIRKNGSIPIKKPIDCRSFADHVHFVTEEHISESTLKRFFGFHNSAFAPSYHTIKVLRKYVAVHISPSRNQDELKEFVLNFFKPLHISEISKNDTGYQIACRSIAILLRNNRKLFMEVHEELANNKVSREFYYEQFPDYEVLSEFQYLGYKNYLKYEKGYEGKIFGNCILFMKYVFDDDRYRMKRQWNKIADLYDKRKTLSDSVLGRYYQVMIIGHFYFKKSHLQLIINEVLDFHKLRNASSKVSKPWDEAYPGFHYFLCDAFYHIKAFNELKKISEMVLFKFERIDEYSWKGYYDQMYLYYGLALKHTGELKMYKKQLKFINPKSFYFISKLYFDGLYQELIS